MKTVKDLDPRDRPREKLLQKGKDSLSNEELLQVIVGSGVKGADVIKISKDILKVMKKNNAQLTLEDLKLIKGISTATAAKLVASLEIAHRFTVTGTRISSLDDVGMLLADIRIKKQEHFILLTFDGAERLINRHTIAIGTVNASMIHPRDIFLKAIEENAASIIIAHNHPGGSTEPSAADLEVTNRIKDAGKLLGIPLQNHIIITADNVRPII